MLLNNIIKYYYYNIILLCYGENLMQIWGTQKFFR